MNVNLCDGDDKFVRSTRKYKKHLKNETMTAIITNSKITSNFACFCFLFKIPIETLCLTILSRCFLRQIALYECN